MAANLMRDDPAALAGIVRTIQSGLITLDGCAQSGKSTLACTIGRQFDIPVIHVDCYVHKRQDRYIAALRTNELKKRLAEALSVSAVAILEGVCARDVLKAVGFSASLFIYVQRNSTENVPGDLDILDYEDPPDGVELAVFECALDREIADYHQREHPRSTADVLYVRTEVDGT